MPKTYRDNETFEGWMAEVDALVESSIGLSTRDLPDRPYYDWYEDYLSPKMVARKVIGSALSGLI